MMGASVPPSGEFGSFYQMLALLKDHDEYTTKLHDLEQRVNTAQKTLEQATENNRKAEEHQKAAQEMFTAANMKVEDANARVKDAVRLTDAAAGKERELQVREASLERTRIEMNTEFAAQKAALDQANKAAAAELEHSNANFITEQQAIATKIDDRWQAAADKEAAVNKREEELKNLQAENKSTRDMLLGKMQELDEKLAKLKAIAGA